MYLEPGDIVLSREGTVGVLAIVPVGMKASMGQRLVQVRTSSKINSRYLLQVLLRELSPEIISHRMVGATSRHLNVKDLRKLPVPVPPLELQETFANRIAAVERLKESHRKHLAELDALFASLQHRAFKGEL
jgi:type I restriction enzyme S subunit